MIRTLTLKPEATKEDAEAFEAYAQSKGIWVSSFIRNEKYAFTLQFDDQIDLLAFLCAIATFSTYEVE